MPVIAVLVYVLLLGVNGVLALLSVRAWRRGEAPPSVSAAVPSESVPVWSIGSLIGLLLMGLAALFGDSPSTMTWLGAWIMTAAILTSFSISLFGRPRVLVPPVLRNPPQFKPDRGERHRVTILHFRSAQESDEYYVPTCCCEWEGEDQRRLEDAFEEARRHTPNVNPRVERPLG